MSDKQLTRLGLTALALLVAALLVGRLTHRGARDTVYGTPLIQGLNPDQIQQIVLGVGDNAGTLQRRENRFVAAEKDDYPAAATAINRLIASCLDITVMQRVTDRAENHEALGVTEEAARSVVRFLDANGAVLTGMVVGNRAEGAQGSYVRRYDSDAVYLSNNVPSLQTSLVEYLPKQIFEVDAGKIQQVSVTYPGGEYAIIAGADGAPALLTAPDGRTPKSYEVRRVFEALTRVDFADVRRADETADALPFEHAYTARLENDIVYTVHAAQHDGKIYLRCFARFEGDSPLGADRNEMTPEQQAQANAAMTAQQEALRFAHRHTGWVYEVARWQGDKFTRSLEDLLEAPPAEEEDAADAPDTDHES